MGKWGPERGASRRKGRDGGADVNFLTVIMKHCDLEFEGIDSAVYISLLKAELFSIPNCPVASRGSNRSIMPPAEKSNPTPCLC
jgi:hypothetical protein